MLGERCGFVLANFLDAACPRRLLLLLGRFRLSSWRLVRSVIDGCGGTASTGCSARSMLQARRSGSIATRTARHEAQRASIRDGFAGQRLEPRGVRTRETASRSSARELRSRLRRADGLGCWRLVEVIRAMRSTRTGTRGELRGGADSVGATEGSRCGFSLYFASDSPGRIIGI